MATKSEHKFSSGTWVERELFESKAFIALKGVAPQVLIHFLGKRQFHYVELGKKKKYTCLNCDSISFTYIEAEENPEKEIQHPKSYPYTATKTYPKRLRCSIENGPN